MADGRKCLSITHYDVLKVDMDATTADIKKVYTTGHGLVVV